MNENGLNYIDLFAGAGGLSEGFIQSGYRPVAHVEMNEHAAKTIETRIAYDAVNGKLLQVLDADALIVENPENMLAVSLLESIPEFSSDDAEFILDVVDQYLALIEGTDEEKKKIVRR